MSTLHEAARRVVSAWVGTSRTWVEDVNATVMALEAALKAQPEPAGCETEADCDSQPWCRISGECHRRRKPAEPAQEPVAAAFSAAFGAEQHSTDDRVVIERRGETLHLNGQEIGPGTLEIRRDGVTYRAAERVAVQPEPAQGPEPVSVDQLVMPLVESALQAVAEKIGDQCAVWYGIGARDVEAVLREAARYGLVRTAQPEPVADPFADLRDKRMGELNAEQTDRATELWLREQIGPREDYWYPHLQALFRIIDRLRAQPEPAQEPVAKVRWNDIGHISWRTQVMLPDNTPLYTAPPQRPPLTDEEIAAEWRKASECAGKSEGAVTTSQFVQIFARAIERKVRGEKE